MKNNTNYLNVVTFTTIVVKMKTLINKVYWKIVEIFYLNKNKPVHLREISRKIKLDQSALTRHLNKLTNNKILECKKEGNMKKFCISPKNIHNIFPIYDKDKLESLPMLRKNAIELYIDKLEDKPVFILLFGSTAKKTFTDESDIDIIIICNKKIDTKKAKEYAEAQTGITISEFQIKYTEFKKEIKLKEDNVIQAGIETGFPVYNNQEYYKEFYNERV
jgi:predicted nucleotidyltransferase